MAVRLRPQSAAWMAPHALAAQLAAQTGQIAGQGVAGLLGGIAQGVGAFTQKREQRRVEGINERRYQDSLGMRQQEMALRKQAADREDAEGRYAILSQAAKGAENKVMLWQLTNPGQPPPPEMVMESEQLRSSLKAITTRFSQGVPTTQDVAQRQAPASGMTVNGKTTSQMTDAELDDVMAKSQAGQLDVSYTGGATRDMGQGVGGQRTTNGDMREPYPGELDYFRKNPHVSGMATEDNKVILNPYSKLSKQEQLAVVENERARIRMRTSGVRPDFALTPQQRERFVGYGSEQDIRETVAARIHSGDPSAGAFTEQQRAWVAKNLSGQPSAAAPETAPAAVDGLSSGDPMADRFTDAIGRTMKQIEVMEARADAIDSVAGRKGIESSKLRSQIAEAKTQLLTLQGRYQVYSQDRTRKAQAEETRTTQAADDARAQAARMATPEEIADAEALGAPKGLKTKVGVSGALASEKQQRALDFKRETIAKMENRAKWLAEFRRQAAIELEGIRAANREPAAQARALESAKQSQKSRMAAAKDRYDTLRKMYDDGKDLGVEFYGDATTPSAWDLYEAEREKYFAMTEAAQAPPDATGGGYPSWLPPEERQAWDAMPDSEKTKAIEKMGR